MLEYLECSPLIFYVTSQIPGIPSRNQKQFMAFGSHDSVPRNCDVTSLI